MHLGEPVGGAESLLEAVSFKKATEGMGRGRVANVRWERVPHSEGCNTKTTGNKGSANTRNVRRNLFADRQTDRQTDSLSWASVG